MRPQHLPGPSPFDLRGHGPVSGEVGCWSCDGEYEPSITLEYRIDLLIRFGYSASAPLWQPDEGGDSTSPLPDQSPHLFPWDDKEYIRLLHPIKRIVNGEKTRRAPPHLPLEDEGSDPPTIGLGFPPPGLIAPEGEKNSTRGSAKMP